MRDYALELEGKGILPHKEESLEDYVERAEERMNDGYMFQEKGDIDSLKGQKFFVKEDMEPVDLSEEAKWLDNHYDIEPDWVPGATADLRFCRGYALSGSDLETEYVMIDESAPKSTRRHELLHVARNEGRGDMKAAAVRALTPWKGHYSEEEIVVDEFAEADLESLKPRFMGENGRVQGINMVEAVTGFNMVDMCSSSAVSLPTPLSEAAIGIGVLSGLVCMKGVASVHEASSMQHNLSKMRGELDGALVRLNTDELKDVAERYEGDTADALASYTEEQDGLKFEFLQERYSELLE